MYSPYLLFLLGSDRAIEYLMVVDLNIREGSKCTCERRLCRKRYMWWIQSICGTNISYCICYQRSPRASLAEQPLCFLCWFNFDVGKKSIDVFTHSAQTMPIC